VRVIYVSPLKALWPTSTRNSPSATGDRGIAGEMGPAAGARHRGGAARQAQGERAAMLRTPRTSW